MLSKQMLILMKIPISRTDYSDTGLVSIESRGAVHKDYGDAGSVQYVEKPHKKNIGANHFHSRR
jgi:hypothetical protein